MGFENLDRRKISTWLGHTIKANSPFNTTINTHENEFMHFDLHPQPFANRNMPFSDTPLKLSVRKAFQFRRRFFQLGLLVSGHFSDQWARSIWETRSRMYAS